MEWGYLFFLSKAWFVGPWYGIGLLGTLFVILDTRTRNTALKPAIRWAWPIIVFFFSIIGLALYFATARAPGIDEMKTPEEKKQAHDRYEQSPWRRVNGAVIHCVAGDGFGIMTAMVIARAASMSFWQEFWFEYIVGYAMGWFIFQRKSMTMMTDSLPMQLAMAFRSEFFSMLTVMGGMGAVMTYITPLATTLQPKPLTYAFWGFGMLGLLVGYVLTFPMNWMMVAIGWKHGMGGKEGAEPMLAKAKPARMALLAAMLTFGCGGLFLPAWLTRARHRASLALPAESLLPSGVAPGEALFSGLGESLARASDQLQRGSRTAAVLAIDDAYRAAEAGAYSAPGSFYHPLEQLRGARLALQQGHTSRAVEHLMNASRLLRPALSAAPPLLDLREYVGATVIDQRGAIIGEVAGTAAGTIDIALDGWRDLWGFADLGPGVRVSVPASALAFGPPRSVGPTLVLLPAKG